MSTTAAPAALMTAEEFYEFRCRPDNAGRRLELESGEVVEMPSPGEMHGAVCWLVAAVFTDYVRSRRSGYLCTNDTGLIVGRDPDTVRGPDILLFLGRRTLGGLNRGHADGVPDLLVEVFSPSDRPGTLAHRVAQYRRRGAPQVWVVFPEDRTVNVYRAGEGPLAFGEGDELDGGAELPGFHCRVADLFTLPGE